MHPGFAPVAVMAGIDVRENRAGALAWGLAHKHYVRRNVIHRLIPVNAMRQVPSEMRMDIDGEGKARVEYPRTPSVLAHGPHMLSLARRLAEPAGGKVLVTGIPELVLDQGGNHTLGGARMSDDPATGVVDPDGQVHGAPGLYVTDASAIPSSLGINPALTVGANAHRIGARLASGRHG
jgi:choline dehydrogenase-like flavoprotein